MFFSSASEISDIARNNGCSIFVVPDAVNVDLPQVSALVLEPEEKSVITIEQVRNALARLSVKQTSDFFVLIRPADLMGDEASNALLKSLEEPKEKVHFVLVTSKPSKLLPTVLSRSAIYYLKTDVDLSGEITADKRVKELAKKLIVARPAELADIATEITKKKDGVRAFSMSVLSVAIEMLYKSYFITGKSAFLGKIPKFLACYEAIDRNGHIKLHLVADLM